ncbi:30S ribosomal protein S21 [candidate division WWE3 bacterium CG10_big_fil_rev_8_21_14_0_10_48_23]|uniref:Small ribosomal subunit protein bS21 n=1 Tax=candidate division WWE3 bacterium CG_4_9_14_0_2_um_filter_48_10 TaxID=1975078 RepID=A0A2M8EJ17_UNCKA|nr:MAG: 30S ribosomal protein S21 [candidate division WWE3 bacterium CG_4_9_14_0_2_um_filter_48_10]PJE50827.1 MAG: 30S ribosomal protein S21 [candidate division WWE3 bacterium CG10_big_fil_rev_8_21_14_0_10_48_23]
MAKVILKEGESLDEALRRFKREVLREGILRELRRREFYEKPSEVKKRERAAKKRMIERARQEEQIG